ncbi:sensor histidine kinase [Frankia sp. Ag45/Mut15]|uniref:histidine kinase n=1 Tax=Frankia umida TaxID=573489 RepID=A0ABT0JZT4_9ACTN|nr:sensor histidine kinase [Frankia umida]MCK9877054.1 sensor histidine kinase [Frankia umida]
MALPVLVGLFLVALAFDRPGLWAPWCLVGVVVGLGQGAALWWRGRYPVAVMAITLVGGAISQLVNPEMTFPYAAMVAIVSLAAARPPLVSLSALALLCGVAALNFFTASAVDTWFVMAIAVVPWALGEAVRNRRAALVVEAARAVAEERMRIAREMHDVLAHSMSAIIVQASAADDVFDVAPDKARAALRTIETTSRDVLAELRHLLAAVRPGDQDGPSNPADDAPRPADPVDPARPAALPRRPQPGLREVEELAAPLRAAGVAVDLRVDGAARPLPAGVDLAAYRIVQEALTNALRHAAATRVVVTLHYDRDVLELRVADNGTGGPASDEPTRVTASAWPLPSAGHGITGMRERAAMVGGQLEAARQARGGFHVRATLPLGGPR